MPLPAISNSGGPSPTARWNVRTPLATTKDMVKLLQSTKKEAAPSRRGHGTRRTSSALGHRCDVAVPHFLPVGALLDDRRFAERDHLVPVFLRHRVLRVLGCELRLAVDRRYLQLFRDVGDGACADVEVDEFLGVDRIRAVLHQRN